MKNLITKENNMPTDQIGASIKDMEAKTLVAPEKKSILVQNVFGSPIISEVHIRRQRGKYINLEIIPSGTGDIYQRSWFGWMTEEDFNRNYKILEC